MCFFAWFMFTLAMVIESKSAPSFIFLLINTAFLVGSLGWWLVSKWVFMVISLIFLGGMMVLFSYMVTLSPNTKLYFGGTRWGVIFVLAGLMAWISTVSPALPLMHTSLGNEIYMGGTMSALSFLMLFLLLVLLVVVKLVEGFKGSLTKVY